MRDGSVAPIEVETSIKDNFLPICVGNVIRGAVVNQFCSMKYQNEEEIVFDRWKVSLLYPAPAWSFHAMASQSFT